MIVGRGVTVVESPVNNGAGSREAWYDDTEKFLLLNTSPTLILNMFPNI